jgi:DNA-directed RNA polymerase II subunit RPB3
MTPEQRADWASSDPNQILKYDAESGSVTLGDVEAYAYDNECVIRCAELGFPGAIEVVQKQDTFVFTVEATGALPPAEVVLNAIDVLKDKLDIVLADIELNPEGGMAM